jgi:hypothetical protein
MVIALLLALQVDDPFRWFDALGYPDLKGTPFVRVAVGESTKRPGQDPEVVTHPAFLLDDKGETFSVLTLDLERRDFTKVNIGLPGENVGYEKADLEKAALERIRALSEPDDERNRRGWNRPSSDTELFALARACDRQGQAALARRLLAAAEKRPDPRGREPAPLRKRVTAELAMNRIWKAVRDFGDPAIPRQKLLDAFTDFAKTFPDSEHATTAKDTVKLLQVMLEEDKQRPGPGRPLDQLPAGERVAELIFQLRDQNGAQHSQPGECDIFADPKGEASPAHQLVRLGFDAVPPLIEALGDERFTRSVGFHRDFYYSHHVLRVGDAALSILQRIAGRRFFERNYTNAAMVKDEAVKATREAARAWWSEIQKKGEKQVLLEAAEKGDLDQARRLLDRHPDLALAALTKALAAAKEGGPSVYLIQMIGEIPGEASTAVLVEALKSPDSLIAAAKELLARGRPEPLPALLRAWTTPQLVRPDVPSFRHPNQALAAVLIATRDADAIRTIAKSFPDRSREDRRGVIQSLALPDDILSHFAERARAAGVSAERETAAQAAEEDLLAAALDDTTLNENMSMSSPTLSITDPRMCDLAAHVLSTRWPERYRFNVSGDRRSLNRELVDVRNAWRKTRGLAPLTAEPKKEVVPLDAVTIDPLVDALLRGDAGSEEALFAKGAPALKAAHARWAKLEKSNARRAALEDVVRRLGRVVSDVEAKPLKDADALNALVGGLGGTPLDAESLKRFLEKACAGLPKGVAGFRLIVERDASLTGIRVLLEWVTERVPRGSGVPGWTADERVSLDKEDLLNSGGSFRENYATTNEGFEDLRDPVTKVLASAPAMTFSIHVSRILKD